MRSRNWMFTINNPETEDDPKNWEYKYLIFQEESGLNGTNHFQGYVSFKSAKSLSAVKIINQRAHWEVRKGSHEQAKAYCSKEETRIGVVFEDGEEPSQGKRNDLNEVRERINEGATELEIAEDYFTDWCRYYKAFNRYRILKMPKRRWKTIVSVLHGETGTGKTRLAWTKYPNAYSLENGKWWDGYDGHENVIIDEFYGWLPYAYLLKLLDRNPMSVETKGGAANFVAKRIIITSNQKPNSWYAYTFAQLERRITNIVEFTQLCVIIRKGDYLNI